MTDRAICAARAAWYDAYEACRVRSEQHIYRHKVAPGVIPPTTQEDWEFGLYCAGLLKPLVTVYVPTFNRAGILWHCAIPSVLDQTYENWELIVAAHGCTDHTDALIRGLAGVNPKVRLLVVPRTRTYPPSVENHWFAGPVVPANAALREARGDWIARIDDDDTWTPDHLEKLLQFAQNGGYEFVSSAYERERDGVREVVQHDGGVPPIGGTQTWLYRSYLRFMRYNPDCWRKKWNRPNDLDLADRLRRAGARIGWLDEVTAHVLPRPGETTVGLAAYQKNPDYFRKHFAF